MEIANVKLFIDENRLRFMESVIFATNSISTVVTLCSRMQYIFGIGCIVPQSLQKNVQIYIRIDRMYALFFISFYYLISLKLFRICYSHTSKSFPFFIYERKKILIEKLNFKSVYSKVQFNFVLVQIKEKYVFMRLNYVFK